MAICLGTVVNVCENPDTLRRDLKERIGKGNTSFWVVRTGELPIMVLKEVLAKVD